MTPINIIDGGMEDKGDLPTERVTASDVPGSSSSRPMKGSRLSSCAGQTPPAPCREHGNVPVGIPWGLATAQPRNRSRASKPSWEREQEETLPQLFAGEGVTPHVQRTAWQRSQGIAGNHPPLLVWEHLAQGPTVAGCCTEQELRHRDEVTYPRSHGVSGRAGN